MLSHWFICSSGLSASILGASVLLPLSQPEQPAQPEIVPQSVPAEMKVKVVEPGAPGEIKTADDLLTSLERADANLSSLQAEIRFDRAFEIAGDRQIRFGKLYFTDSNPGATAGVNRQRRFAVVFDQLQLGRRVENTQKIHVFDGEWYIEKTPKDKQFAKRRIVAPGENFDPLKLGQGPFPLPVGQKRDDILARYNAELVASADGLVGEAWTETELSAFKAHAADCIQLHLTPKTESENSVDLTDIRLWYKRWTDAKGTPWLLPRMARTVNTIGDIAVVQLINVEPNAQIPQDVMNTETPEGWDGQVMDAAPAPQPKAEPAPQESR